MNQATGKMIKRARRVLLKRVRRVLTSSHSSFSAHKKEVTQVTHTEKKRFFYKCHHHKRPTYFLIISE